MTRFGRRDLFCGFAFVGLAVLYGFRASGYRLGSASQMGPGYFPLILSVILFLLGIGVVVKGLVQKDRLHLSSAEMRSALAVLSSVVVFGLLIEPAGLLIAGSITGVICQLGSSRFSAVRAMISAVCLSLGTTAVFAWALQLPLPILPSGW